MGKISSERIRWFSHSVSRSLCGMLDRTGKLPSGVANAEAVLKALCPGTPFPPTTLLKATERWCSLSGQDEEKEYVPVLVSHLVTAIAEITDIHLDYSITQKDIEYMSRTFTVLGCLGCLESSFKSHTAWLNARAMGDLLPEVPPADGLSPGKIFSPRLNRKIFMRCVLRRRPQDVSLSNSLYQAKRVAPPLPEKRVNCSLSEMLERVTREENDTECSVLHEVLGKEILRTVKEMGESSRKQGWTGRVASLPFPSQSASLETSVANGGQLQSLVPERHGLGFGHLIAILRRGQYVFPVYGWDETTEPELRQLLSNGECPVALSCRRHPVLEPFKVRTITMGPSKQYFRARQIQGCLWDLLKGERSTHLPNRPLDDSDVSFFVERGGNKNFPGEELLYVSGDYSAATDNIRPSLSSTCVDALCDLLSDDRGAQIDMGHPLRLLFHRVLTNHNIVEGKRGLESTIGTQTWGQLMGSPLSFPILCIINLSVTRFVLERLAGHVIRLRDSGIIVNGDDILFKMPKRGYPLWQRCVKAVGLNPSPGKNYMTPRYSTMNSIVFDNIGRTVSRVPFLKMNLLFGTQAKGCERRTTCELLYGSQLEVGGSLGDRCRALITGFPVDIQRRLISKFVHHARPFLDSAPGVSWWLAKSYGGLGLPTVDRPRILTTHLRVAAYLSCGGTEQAEARLYMEWLQQPSKQFNSATLSRVLEVARNLNVPSVQVPIGVRDPCEGPDERYEAPFKKALLLSALRLGVEFPETELGEKERMRDWHKFYAKLCKKASKSYFRGGNRSDGNGLYAMGWEKAIRGPTHITRFDWSARAGCGRMSNSYVVEYQQDPLSMTHPYSSFDSVNHALGRGE